MENLNVIIAIDDLHPDSGYGLQNDDCTKILQKLNEDFGCKFVLFIPSNYDNEFPLSKHKDWIDFWHQKDWIELAAHGHFHKRSIFDPSCRECEFLELDKNTAKERLELCLQEWDSVGVRPKGWRMPGWMATQESFDVIGKEFDYLAVHETHNSDIEMPKKHIFCHSSSIHEQNQLYIRKFKDENCVFFQSHINGKYNENNWDDNNFLIFKNTLNILFKNFEKLNFKTFNEII